MKNAIKYKVKNNILQIIETGIDVAFDWPISDVLCFDDIFVVRIEAEPGVCFNENVFGVSKIGNLIWRVEKRKHVYDDSPYTSIIAKDNYVKLFNWDGDELLIEPKNGKVINLRYGK